MSRIAIFPGTFDPFTNGHKDIADRACDMFDKLIITIAKNSSKTPLFLKEERKAMISEIYKGNECVEVEFFDNLLVNFAEKKEAVAIIRGLRAVSDFEYEMQMALMNRHLAPNIHTIFLTPAEEYSYLNSSIVKEVARHGGNFKRFVPENIYLLVKDKFLK
jgi:pantetheine-phosphate adenylyltransferase